MKHLWIFFGCLFLLVASFILWYSVASDYGDSVASGTYFLDENGQTSTLVLKPNHSFQQELSEHGEEKRAIGTWRRIGEGSITFSKEFLTVSGQERVTDGTAVADMHKQFGFFVSLEPRQYHVQPWYEKTDPSSDNVVSSTYTAKGDWGFARLVLKADHSFEQTINTANITKQASGNWSVSQSGDIVFSEGFLKTSGEVLSSNETASALNSRGPYLQIVVATKSGKPTFRKKQLF